MALLHMDSFDFYATTHLSQLYDSVDETGDPGVYVSATGRNGTNSLRIRATSGGSARTPSVRKNFGTAVDTMIVGFGLQVINNDSGSIQLLAFYEGNLVTRHMGLWISVDNGSTCDLLVVNGANATLSTLSAAIPLGTYVYIEFKTKIHDTTGTWEVWKNGVSIGSASGVDTRNGGTSGVIGSALIGNDAGNSNNYDVRYDDLVFLDTTGSAPNNDRIGDVRVAVLVPSGAGNYAQWTPSAGSNYQNVDDLASVDDDTTYNSEATAGDKDSFAMGNLPTTPSTVYAIAESIRYRKDDAGSSTIRQLLRISSTDYEDADISVADAYTYTRRIRETNPNTTAAWTGSDVDGLEAGYKRQT
jgi:hypothetical protein